MRNPILIPEDTSHPGVLKGIYESLTKLNNQLANELANKQNLIESKDQEYQQLGYSKADQIRLKNDFLNQVNN